MSIKVVSFTSNYGGQATDLKLGPKHSFAYSQGFDFRKNPSQISVLPGLTREDNNIVKDLILKEVMVNSGIIYAFGNAGNLYKRTNAGAWSQEGTLSAGTGGMDYRSDADSIYLTTTNAVSLLNNISGTPALVQDNYGPSYSTYDNSITTGFNVAAYQTSSNSTTTLGTTLLEQSTTLRYFQTDIEPLVKISVFITAKGTGDWTLTLHDGLNAVLGTKTVTNANLNNNAWNDFAFTAATNKQIRVYPAPNARTYHIHVTSTVADGVISSSRINDLSSCDLEVWADRLIVTKNGLHPMIRYQQFEAIGNANYLSIWEPITPVPTNSEWVRHKLTFPQEYEVCGLTRQNEFIVIAAEKTTSSTTLTPQGGILFFWDGTSPTYNYFIEIPEGSPYGLSTYKNVAYYIAGGAWYGVTSATTQPVKLRTLPGSDTEYSGLQVPVVTGYPDIMTVRHGILLTGYPATTNNPTINYGVYSWGAVDKNYPNSFGYSYVLSTGDQIYTNTNNLQIGMVKSFGDLLHVSWRDDTATQTRYGIDVITNSSTPATTAIWQSPIVDGGYASKQKTALFIEAYYSLPVGGDASIKLGYSINRGTFVNSPAYTTTTLWQTIPGYAKLPINASGIGRFYELQAQATITCTSATTTAPVIYMLNVVYDDNSKELIV